MGLIGATSANRRQHSVNGKRSFTGVSKRQLRATFNRRSDHQAPFVLMVGFSFAGPHGNGVHRLSGITAHPRAPVLQGGEASVPVSGLCRRLCRLQVSTKADLWGYPRTNGRHDLCVFVQREAANSNQVTSGSVVLRVLRVAIIGAPLHRQTGTYVGAMCRLFPHGDLRRVRAFLRQLGEGAFCVCFLVTRGGVHGVVRSGFRADTKFLGLIFVERWLGIRG